MVKCLQVGNRYFFKEIVAQIDKLVSLLKILLQLTLPALLAKNDPENLVFNFAHDVFPEQIYSQQKQEIQEKYFGMEWLETLINCWNWLCHDV